MPLIACFLYTSAMQLIFGDYTSAEDHNWHIEHFCCISCDDTLGGKEYLLRDNQPHCCECYAKLFTSKCEVLKQTIFIYFAQIFVCNSRHAGKKYQFGNLFLLRTGALSALGTKAANALCVLCVKSRFLKKHTSSWKRKYSAPWNAIATTKARFEMPFTVLVM